MSRSPERPLWQTLAIAGHSFQVLDLDHPAVAAHVLHDMDAGVDVYYDQRWACTTRLCHFLLEQPAWVTGRCVLVLGAGIGLETLVLGRLCQRLYINDLAPAALTLCAKQLRQNAITTFACLPGRYETLELPAVDLIVGSFLVYNRETGEAMRQFLSRPTPPVLLVNDHMPAFRTLLRGVTRRRQALLPPDDTPCLLFP